jgi:hypothetical protein
MWKPRHILQNWTPDQERVARCFPSMRRVCVPAANGVGKTYLAADLVASFLADHPAASVIITAPTNRQVCELLWPHIADRLRGLGLAQEDWKMPSRPKWSGEDGDRLIGFATNTPQRMQGFHAEHLLIVLDEASGMPTSLVHALEGIAVGEQNYILAIGNPNEAQGAFFDMTRAPSWHTEVISALTHPNIVSQREVIPGATTWISMVDRIRDWCQIYDQPTNDTIEIALSDAELQVGVSTERVVRHVAPNDAFRVRYLGRFPSAVQWTLIERRYISQAQQASIPGEKPRIAALDVARTGGDRTIYVLRQGDTVTRVVVVPATDFTKQAEFVQGLLDEDQPERITVDAAGMGCGMVEILMKLASVQIISFLGAETPIAPSQQKRYYNRRTAAYGNLAEAFAENRIAIPSDEELADELAAMRFRYTEEQKMQMLRKEDIKKTLGRSPDKADAISLCWEYGTDYASGAAVAQTVQMPEVIRW